jgi:hypothetical protein
MSNMLLYSADRICDDEGNALYGREYDLGKACKKLGIHIKTFKAWEKKGFIPKVRRNPIIGY